APPAPSAGAGTPAPSPATPVPAETAPPAPAEPEVTPQSELMAMVRSTPETATLPLDVTINYYKAAESSTFVTLTLEVKRSALPPAFDPDTAILSAEAVDAATGESQQRFFKAEHFGSYAGNPSATVNDTLLYQAERSFNPGIYKVMLALKDPASGQVGRMEKELVIPSFTDGDFTLSTVTLARKIERLATPPEAGKILPFVLGNFTVVPRPDNVYKQGEELTFYFQIYGPAVDEITKQPKVDLSYTFEKEVAGQWKMVGRQPVVTPNESKLVQAFGLPLTGWPAGSYRVAIKVTDTIASKTATSVVPFTIEGAAGGASKSKAKSKG
ncbi:MAG: hypothetical protein ACREAA_21760, partial [Candidatus Polarisedimenticolia bacterium]